MQISIHLRKTIDKHVKLTSSVLFFKISAVSVQRPETLC